MNKLLVINERDNVAVALCNLKKGYTENGITLLSDVPFGHKVLLSDLNCGENVIKYGCPIGHVTENCKKGSYVHEHNLKTNLNETAEYSFDKPVAYTPEKTDVTVNAYKRKNGKIGVRNELWLIPTVGCVNKTAELLEKLYDGNEDCDGVYAFTHPYGCSQMSSDQELTRKTLAALINHPNAGGVLIISLGCENSGFETLLPYLKDYDKERVKLLVCQDCEDELETGKELINGLLSVMKNDVREPVSIDKLVVGFKCGGSDAFSGITANAVCGAFNDKLTSCGASTILTEVPEMFGAENILMARSISKEVFEKQVKMINGFKDYFSRYGMVCYENPSPGNHEGGITTLEEKSLGCVQKGGTSPVCDVLGFAEECNKSGLNLLYGPGNDMVSVTDLTAAGAHIILFTTGRGTPLGAPVPTLKLSSNTPLFEKKRGWLDFNCGGILDGETIEDNAEKLLSLIIETASGKKTKNEINGYRDIALFKDGVTM